MDLVIKNRIIRTPIKEIIYKLKKDCSYDYFNYIGNQKGNDLKITCPFHKEGHESHPSCHIFCDYNDPKIYYGTVHCFTCGKRVPLYSMVGYCLDGDDELGKDWLIDNFGDTFLDESLFLNEIDLDKKQNTKNYLNESILNQYNFYHPYMEERKLTPYVLNKFKIGYDSKLQALTFPVWDVNNNLLFITKRSVNSKFFIIPENVEKPVYLLNFVLCQNYPYLVICESQINALTLWGYGIPAVALFGTGSEYQYELLKKSGIRNFVLAFDGDDAGRRGCEKFIGKFKNNCIITVLDIPEGKDINDLDRSYVEYLMNKNNLYFRLTEKDL